MTGLRGIAATWVVVFHLSWLLWIAAPGATSALAPLISSGAQGVDLFFLLSGYVLALNYTERIGERPALRNTVRFLGARIARVWPVYVVTLHLAAVVLVVLGVTFVLAWLLYRFVEEPGRGRIRRMVESRLARRTDRPAPEPVDLPIR